MGPKIALINQFSNAMDSMTKWAVANPGAIEAMGKALFILSTGLVALGSVGLISALIAETTVIFAPHHGRKSGKLPDKWLEKLRPKIIVIGEAESRHLHYYTGYNKITQNKAGDITFIQDDRKLHCYASYEEYGMRDWLDDEGKTDREFYIGTLNF